MDKLGEDFEDLKRSAREIPEVREYLDREDGKVDKITIKQVQPIGHKYFYDYDSFIYQNEVNPRMSDRRSVSGRILINESNKNKFKNNYNLEENFSWHIFSTIPILIDEYKNKFIVDKVLETDYKYNEKSNELDYKIIYEYYEGKNGVSYEEMIDARVRIFFSKISKIKRIDKLDNKEKYMKQIRKYNK